ncbi:hypothetical protein CC80DRAFT_491038 [Byssothecium circinans]|uniref:WD-like domain-containing protein n=1 Tax=Byssothecium circinans TaxID=147558 RepID=A0A6A5U3E7_9PLEO|nr:hypothetical protein CC80DRAFT_491038 [Byssothecium circinans]
MQFSTVTLLITSLMATGLMATPFAAGEEANLVELRVEPRKGGSVVQYAEIKRSVAPRADCGKWFQPACPKQCKVTDISSPECDTKNGGTNSVCASLVNDLYGNRESALQDGAQQICWKNEDGKTGCCVKWTKKVPGITKGDLVGRADKIQSKCDANGISGKYNTVNIRNVCLSYCMSSGAKCKDESDFS